MNKLMLLAVSVLFCSFPITAAEEIKLWYRNYDKSAILEFVNAALEVTRQSHGPANVVRSLEIALGRAVAQLENGSDVDLIVTALTAEKERKFKVIYEPIDKGLLGIRLCLVLKRNANFFKDMNSVADFRAQKNLIWRWQPLDRSTSHGFQ